MMKRYLLLLGGLIALAALLHALVGSTGASGAGIKQWILPVASLYLDTFNNPATALVLSFAMGLSGLAIIVFFWVKRFNPINAELRWVLRKLNMAKVKPGSAQAMAVADEVLGASDLLARHWRAFRREIAMDADGAHVRFAEPSERFSLANIRIAARSASALRAFAGDFVGIGLVFTFLGLVAGLYFAGRSMLSADLGAAREALIQLLHASTFKFLTSIMGIGMSLILTWANRIFVSHTEQEIDELNLWIEDKFPGAPHTYALQGHQSAAAPVDLPGVPAVLSVAGE
ncbi:MAG: hypothetical protein M9944_02130 [Rhizobiaceae bacterium]|nr:hypothetical protein [Rhizobiaceae bacterium]